MKKPTFIWMASFLLAGFVLAANEEKIDTNSTETKKQQDEMASGPVQHQDSDMVAAKLPSGDTAEIPIKIGFDSSSPLQVELTLKHNSALILQAAEKSDEWFFPVKVKESWKTIWISVAAVVVAVISSVFAWRSANNAKLAAQGNLFFELIHRYDSDNMGNALRKVWKWDKDRVGKDKSKRREKAKEFVENKAKGDSHALELNQARRKVTHYYLNVLRLGQLKYLNKSVIEHIFKEIGSEILDVLEPLEVEIIQNSQAKNNIQKQKAIIALKKDFEEIRRIVNE